MTTFSAYLFVFLVASPILGVRYLNLKKSVTESDENTKKFLLRLYLFYAVSSFIIIFDSSGSGDSGLLRMAILAVLSAAGWMIWFWYIGVLIIIFATFLGFKLNDDSE
jgi:hypothetical protein